MLKRIRYGSIDCGEDSKTYLLYFAVCFINSDRIHSYTYWFWWLSFIISVFPNCLVILGSVTIWALRFSISLPVSALLVIIHCGERRTFALQGRPAASLTGFGNLPSMWYQQPPGTLLFLSGPSHPTHCFCQAWGRQIFLLCTAWHSLGEGILLSLLASPSVAPHTVMLRVIPGPPFPLPLCVSWLWTCPETVPIWWRKTTLLML